ncbi:MAG TPA: hypothetical protein VH165_18445 [Kofleriaceae bacterium]|jgi:hypothetical protein|nr:hypothetical protein [Kofleriaceae bacterium]
MKPTDTVMPSDAAPLPHQVVEPLDEVPLNDVQRRILIGAAGLATGRPFTEAESCAADARLRTYGDARSFLAA